MSAKAKFVKLTGVQSDAKSLAGYKVLGDTIDEGQRVLLLERPDVAVPVAEKKPRKPRTKKPAGLGLSGALANKSTEFNPAAKE